LGLPGALPVINGEAVAMAVRAALALDCKVQEHSIFARKQYFYPDLPKGYQISQFEEPFSVHGSLKIEVDGVEKTAGITRIHMEEDAGKNVHGVGGDSVVDPNRAGTPLVEIVGEPDLRSSAEAAAYLRALREVLVSIGINDGNLEEGSFRCDANVSIRPKGSETFGTRVELKNINSFRFVQRAIDTEIARQAIVLDGGGKIVQETRSFDPNTGKTKSLRSKEEAHDYRYFPEPDLPPLRLDAAFIAEQQKRISELPRATRERWVKELGLSPAQAQTLSQHPDIVAFF
jgi:aspartyl-tRNA(Asn)/glutamyl-tRNA(Gln) amidotransferase subunit B